MEYTTSRLLIDDRPLQVLPKLAQLIGLEEAMVLQQVHYWLGPREEAREPGFCFEGRYWVFNTYAAWHAQFPFWSERKLRDVFRSLEIAFRPAGKDPRPERGPLLLAGQFHSDPFNRTKWYSIDRAELARLERLFPMWQNSPHRTGEGCQNEGADSAGTCSESTASETTQTKRAAAAAGAPPRTGSPRTYKRGQTEIIKCRSDRFGGTSIMLDVTAPLGIYYGRASGEADLRQLRRLVRLYWEHYGFRVSQAQLDDSARAARAFWDTKRPGQKVRGMRPLLTAIADTISGELKPQERFQ